MALKAGPGGPAATRGSSGRGVRGRVFRDVASAPRRRGGPAVRGRTEAPARFGFGRVARAVAVPSPPGERRSI